MNFTLGIKSNITQEADSDLMHGFAQLDALTVVSLSIIWVVGVLAVICGVRFISKVNFDLHLQ